MKKLKLSKNGDTGTDSDISVSKYKVGDTVEVGPFYDTKAVVQEVNSNNYILVLESLGCVLKMKINN
jgi:transcription antitermination factor NusG